MTDAPSVDRSEIAKFDRIAGDWWDPEGASKPLHILNPTRLEYIVAQIAAEYGQDPSRLRALEGLRILDVGCGGGLVTEPLARLGATVTGIDAGADGIAVARAHAAEQGLDIDYRVSTVEDLVARGETFDAVLALEIVEHVTDPAAFLAACAGALRPGAPLIVSTVNRTPKSWAAVIFGAEVLLRWLPRGTHEFRRFVTPTEMTAHLSAAGLEPLDTAGMVFDPLRRRFRLSDDDLSVNYLALARRPGQAEA